MVSNQCVYSLIARRFDYDRAEIAMREQVGLLAYSPLAMGMLTGKYDEGGPPKGSRGDLFPEFMKFVDSREFVTSNIIGATTMKQLEENIDAHMIEWTDEMEREAHRIHKIYRCPASR